MRPHMSSRRAPDIKLLQPRTPPDAGACMHGPSSLLRPCMLHLTRGLPHSTPCQAHPRAWQALARPESLTAYARFECRQSPLTRSRLHPRMGETCTPTRAASGTARVDSLIRHHVQLPLAPGRLSRAQSRSRRTPDLFSCSSPLSRPWLPPQAATPRAPTRARVTRSTRLMARAHA